MKTLVYHETILKSQLRQGVVKDRTGKSGS